MKSTTRVESIGERQKIKFTGAAPVMENKQPSCIPFRRALDTDKSAHEAD
jgi:hypothetical protein